MTNERLASNAVKGYGTGNSGTEEQRNTTKVSGVEPDVKAERNTVSVVCFVQLLIAKRNLYRGDCSGGSKGQRNVTCLADESPECLNTLVGQEAKIVQWNQ